MKQSYTSISLYNNCGFKYYLQYVLKNFFYTPNVSAELGSLVHWTEQQISEYIKAGKPIPYEQIKELFYSIHKSETVEGRKSTIKGWNLLYDQYQKECEDISEKSGMSYVDKVNKYLEEGIYRQEQYMKEHPEKIIWDCEHRFEFNYNGEVLNGYIDKILYDDKNVQYDIIDYKTKDEEFSGTDVSTPIQFVIYTLALNKELKITDLYEIFADCYYDLVFLGKTQRVCTNGYMKRGLKKLDETLEDIEQKSWTPKPSPLCHWCPFNCNNPNAPKEGKFLCAYGSKWTRDKKTFEVFNQWQGLQEDKQIQFDHQLKQSKLYPNTDFIL